MKAPELFALNWVEALVILGIIVLFVLCLIGVIYAIRRHETDAPVLRRDGGGKAGS